MLSLSGLKTLQMARWMHSDFSQIKVLYNIYMCLRVNEML